jgi:aspartyl-tRNA(Asn)/glutamyl-tRNA(Gln) amidotransferase subunit B
MAYRPTIGLEIHIELKTKSKMFCSCLNNTDERQPNFNICPICTAQPGTLPVINKEAVRKVIKTGLSLNCRIPEFSKFDRKNYFYPDLPKGYQISQYDKPLCSGGFLEIDGKKVKITRVHLEEDTARLIHEKDCSLVDFNRAGIPLMELVTEPDIASAEEARKFAEELHLIMHYLDVSDADMEKGQMRVEVNISLSKDSKLGTKAEIKNLNSFRSVERAIDYEIQRQTELLDKGERIIQETRGWLDEATASSRRIAGVRVDDVKGITVSQREKEEANDYRYFPEPDLPPLRFTKEFINGIQAEVPELPHQRKERFKREYELDEKSVGIFVYNKNLGEYFEKVISELDSNLSKEKLSRLIKLATNYLISDLQGLLAGGKVSDNNFLITPENFADFITLICEGKISSKIAKMVLEEMFKTGADPSHIIEEKGLEQVSDAGELEKIVGDVIKNNPKVVEDYKKGKENAFQYLIGQIMAKTKGKANPQMVNKILNEILTKLK